MRTKILHTLELHRGEYISGEELAGTLGVSRAAVWKAVKGLREEGHRITAITNKGYCLEKFSDILTAKGITSHLSENSQVRRVICLSDTDSTNNYAKSLAVHGEPHGTLIAANSSISQRIRQQETRKRTMPSPVKKH